MPNQTHPLNVRHVIGIWRRRDFNSLLRKTFIPQSLSPFPSWKLVNQSRLVVSGTVFSSLEPSPWIYALFTFKFSPRCISAANQNTSLPECKACTNKHLMLLFCSSTGNRSRFYSRKCLAHLQQKIAMH